MAYTFGVPTAAPQPPLDEAPKPPRSLRQKAAPETAETAVTHTAPPAAEPRTETRSTSRPSQTQLLEQRADELEALFHRLPAAGDCPAPVDETETKELSGVAFVVDRWQRLFSDGNAAAAAGVPAGSSAEISSPTGAVVVRLTVPAGYARVDVARSLKAYITAAAWGEYKVQPDADENSVYFVRRHAGGDLATPFRVASTIAEKFRTDAEHMRRRVLYTAGLVVSRPDVRNGKHHHDAAGKPAFIRTVPQLIEAKEWTRGVEFVLKMVANQGVSDYVKATEKLEKMFGRPVQIEARDQNLVAVRLVTKPAGELPKNVVLKPSSLYRPANAEQAVKVAKKLVLPIGLTRLEDGTVARVDVRPASTPHGVVVGLSGQGKSRLIRTAASEWALQGGWLAVCDPKGGELVDAWLPGCVHIATNVATISRTLHWARTEMMTRLAVQDVLKKRGVSPAPFQPILILCDEFGQMMTELIGSTDTAEQNAAKEIVRVVVKTMQVGRSVGIHLVLISQNAKVESLPGTIAQSAGWRLIAGRPAGGTGNSGMVDRLFPASMKAAATELGDTIPGGEAGYALLDWKGKPTVAKTFYGYSPGEEPEDPMFADLPAEILANWRDMRAALRAAPPVRRFGWKPGPDTPADWQSLSLYAGKKGDEPTVRSLQPVWLDSIGPDGRPVPIPEHARFDPLSDEYEGGSEPLDLESHLSPTAL